MVLVLCDTMRFGINKKSPLGIKEQLKRQIRTLAESGDLSPGQQLPSARDMATMLRINRNTVSHAYKELAAEGGLEIIMGSGTYVRKGWVKKDTRELGRIYEHAVTEAKRRGFTTEEVEQYFLNQVLVCSKFAEAAQVLVVDCNDEAIAYMCETLENELPVKTTGALIQELEKDQPEVTAPIHHKDLIVCGFNHVQELKVALIQCDVEIVPLMLKPDFGVMNEMLRLPDGTRVGYCCANQRSTETFFRSSFFSGGTELRKIYAGLENSDVLKEMLVQCEVIFASNFVFDRVRAMVGPETRLLRVELTVDQANIDLVRERLIAVRAGDRSNRDEGGYNGGVPTDRTS
jgi:GntR family transcriptional regulator